MLPGSGTRAGTGTKTFPKSEPGPQQIITVFRKNKQILSILLFRRGPDVPAEFAGSSEAIAAPGSSGADPSQPQKHPWIPPLPAPAQGELTEAF